MDENIRAEWRSMRLTPNDTALGEVMTGKCMTALSRLARRYRRFVVLGVLCMILVPWDFKLVGLNEISYIIAFEAIICVCALLDLSLWYRIKSIDCLSMSVSEVVRRTLSCRRLHLGSILVLLPSAIVVVAFLVRILPHYAKIGAIVGGAVGLVIGFRQLLEFLKDYREVIGVDRLDTE